MLLKKGENALLLANELDTLECYLDECSKKLFTIKTNAALYANNERYINHYLNVLKAIKFEADHLSDRLEDFLKKEMHLCKMSKTGNPKKRNYV